jgi:hypothetical protein
MSENWAPIPGRDGYECSDLGQVRSVDRAIRFKDGRQRFFAGRILRPADNGHGYLFVNIAHKSPRVHCLVLETFVGPRPDGMEACHNDGDRRNNRLTNLRWDTSRSNSLDIVRHGRNELALRTLCPRRHPLAHPNLVPYRWEKHGHRVCRACSLATWRCRRYRLKGVELDFKAVADAYYAEILRKVGAA